MKRFFAIILLFLIPFALFSATIVTLKAPTMAEPGSAIVLELTVSNVETNGFARIKQQFPNGFEISPIDVKNASFSFENNEMTLIWEQLPVGTTFTISFNVKIDTKISGTFSIGQGQMDYQKGKGYESTPIRAISISINAPYANTNETVQKQGSLKNNAVSPTIPNINGIVFRVQVAASTAKKNSADIKSRYNLVEPVYEDLLDGIYRYMMGDYKTYDDAKIKSDEFKALTGIANFVTAYELGRRIPIKEAIDKSKAVK